jgi:cytochrome P450
MVNQRQHPSGRDDIFNTLLTAKKPGSDELYSDKDLFGEAIVLFVAGSDTTSTAMLTMLWHLLSHRDTYDNLVKEIRDNFESFGDVSYSKLQHLPYLRAVIEEGLRIFPPNAGFIPRIVSKSDDVFSIHETVLPPGVRHNFIPLADVGGADCMIC